MHAKLLVAGKWTVSALEEGSRCRAEDFLAKIDRRARDRFGVLFERTATEGPIRNDTQFKCIKEHDLWEFKAQQYRIFAFKIDEEQHIILTSGFKEEKKKIPKPELDRAKRMRAEYFESLEAPDAKG